MFAERSGTTRTDPRLTLAEAFCAVAVTSSAPPETSARNTGVAMANGATVGALILKTAVPLSSTMSASPALIPLPPVTLRRVSAATAMVFWPRVSNVQDPAPFSMRLSGATTAPRVRRFLPAPAADCRVAWPTVSATTHWELRNGAAGAVAAEAGKSRTDSTDVRASPFAWRNAPEIRIPPMKTAMAIAGRRITFRPLALI